MKNILKRIGFRNIGEAENGKAAFKELKNQKYDLILSDWNMPRVTGLELLRMVRSDNELKNTPFIMVTAEAQKNNIIEAVQAGVTNFVVKPFTADTINDKLIQVFSN